MTYLTTLAARIVNVLPPFAFDLAPVPVMHRCLELTRSERLNRAAEIEARKRYLRSVYFNHRRSVDR